MSEAILYAVADGIATITFNQPMVMNALELVNKYPNPNEETVRAELDGNLCRCTGYHNIVKAVIAGAAAMKG